MWASCQGINNSTSQQWACIIIKSHSCIIPQGGSSSQHSAHLALISSFHVIFDMFYQKRNSKCIYLFDSSLFSSFFSHLNYSKLLTRKIFTDACPLFKKCTDSVSYHCSTVKSLPLSFISARLSVITLNSVHRKLLDMFFLFCNDVSPRL